MNNSVKERGKRVPYLDEYVDGWQAYCVGKTQRSNPYKRKPDSEEFKKWKEAFLNAKNAEEKGAMSPEYKAEVAKSYYERHPKKA